MVVIERWENDFGPTLVERALCLIYVCRSGISEQEILEIGQIHSYSQWALFYVNAKKFLFKKTGGLISFFHSEFQNAVKNRYLSRTAEAIKQISLYRNLVAQYLIKQPISQRKLSELPWLLYQSSNWIALKDVLLDLELMLQYYNDDTKYEIIDYWRAIVVGIGGDRNDMSPIVHVYKQALLQFEERQIQVEKLGRAYYIIAELFRELSLNESNAESANFSFFTEISCFLP